MLRDVFYYGKKPNVHPREKFATSLADARNQCTTDHFWIINEFCDYKNFDWDFDFEFLPDEDVWAEEHNNVWPSFHQKDSGTWLCPKTESEVIIYRADVEPLRRKNEITDNWKIIENVDTSKFDFSWHPDPTDPAYIYAWGSKYLPVESLRCIEYHVEDASSYKYMDSVVELLPKWENWDIDPTVDRNSFDFAWLPDPGSPPYIYVWGNQWNKPEDKIVMSYTVPGATEYRYMQNRVTRLPIKDNWEIPDNIDIASFDFSWEPNPYEPAFIYQFGTQWQKTGGPRYVVDGATEVKYMDILIAKALPTKDNWVTPNVIDATSFDFSWHPDETEEPSIYQFGTQWQKTGGPKYIPAGTPNWAPVTYVDTIKATKLADQTKFDIVEGRSVASFDYSWHPDDTEEPFIYKFGTDLYLPEVLTVLEYTVPGATSVKYIHDVKAKLTVDMTKWELPAKADISKFDFSWHPDPNDPPFIYQFGTQWQKTGGPRYVVDGATEIKYVDSQKAIMPANKDNWRIPEEGISSFDFSWHPDETEPPFVYQFGTQWQKTGGPTYITMGATETKYIDNPRAVRLPSDDNWTVPKGIDVSKFDFSWHPDHTEEPFIYQFGTQWQKTGGPIYTVPGASEVKFVSLPKAISLPSRENWIIPEGTDVSRFDFSWHPDETNPPQIYIWVDNQVRYEVPGAHETAVIFMTEMIEAPTSVTMDVTQYYIKTTLDALINEHPNEVFWALNPDLKYDKFDFTWRPEKDKERYVNVFGNETSKDIQTYFVNAPAYLLGYKEYVYVEDFEANVETHISMFFVDRGNPETQERFEKLKIRFPELQKTRYLNSWVDTINRCIKRAGSKLCWILNSELDYTDFNFNFYPNTWQMKMVHVFGTQWSHWGTTFMVNSESFAHDTKYVNTIEHLPILNFVKHIRARATNILHDVIYIDHGNLDMSTLNDGRLVVKYEESYFETFKKILGMLPEKKEHYVWVVSTVCDYSGFDFTYICDPFAREQLHVFPSDKQKFGDTFLINVNKLRKLIDGMSDLEGYFKINYNQHQRAKRLPAPVIITEGDTHVSTIDAEFNFPYAIFTTSDNRDMHVIDVEPMSLWTPESKAITVTSTGATRIIVPKEAKKYVKRELYDYPHLITNSKLVKSTPMDIVFLSNGETDADKNYEHLLKVTKGLPNRVTRVDGVNGRVQAYHAAAEASNTPWAFTVFAKLKVNDKFDWSWQPDRLQIPKHYVFHALNPVNGLVYGHQAMIAYNKKLTLANQGKGLDFTMDDEHEVVELLSGVANYNTDEWSTWRTAFREVLKLRAENSEISNQRMEKWLNVGEGEFGRISQNGARDALDYYDEVNGDPDKLKLSYEWEWLRERFKRLSF